MTTFRQYYCLHHHYEDRDNYDHWRPGDIMWLDGDSYESVVEEINRQISRFVRDQLKTVEQNVRHYSHVVNVKDRYKRASHQTDRIFFIGPIVEIDDNIPDDSPYDKMAQIEFDLEVEKIAANAIDKERKEKEKIERDIKNSELELLRKLSAKYPNAIK